MADNEEKTESATSKRRGEQRQKGNVARSQEIITAFMLATILTALMMSSGYMTKNVGELCAYLLGNAAQIKVDRAYAPALAFQVIVVFLKTLAPILVAAVIAGLAGNLVQVGFMITTEPITPKFNKLNPVEGLKGLFNKKEKLQQLVKGIAKLVVLSYVAWLTVKGDIPKIAFLSDVSPRVFLAYEMDLAYRIFKNILIVYIIIAALDYWFQHRQYEEKIKMSKQEVKEEHKQMEGDPQIKRRIRRLQIAAMRRRMMTQVPKADVVITNPTHFAVALMYDFETMSAPMVVAKGADLVAKKIIETAKEHSITIYQAPEVARALFKATEPGDMVPGDLFQAVAEILAEVYKINKKFGVKKG